MKRWIILLVALAFAPAASAQSRTANRIMYGTALPSTCNIDTRDVFIRTNALDRGMYFCILANTWSAIGVNGSAGNLRFTNAAAQIFWPTRSMLASPGDGNILMTDNATTSFNLLQFGGITASYPALKRSTTELRVYLADDSTYTTIAALDFRSSGSTFATLGTPANGTIRYCSDCVINAVCAGAGTGAIAKRLNGAWVCN